MNLRFLDSAEEEMLEAAQVYEDQAVGLGERFLDEVEGCVDLLLDRPYIGRRVGEFRRFPLRKFPFTLIYALGDDDLVVVAVSHHRRRPQAIGWGDMTANQSFEPTPQSGAAQFHRYVSSGGESPWQ